jgi:hypothetical protein
MPKITNLSGTGTLPADSLIAYSYSEDATPFDLNSTSMGAGQISATISVDEGPRGSRLLINNEIQIEDEYFGNLSFIARKYGESNGVGSLTGETIAYKLNAYRIAQPHGGASSSLYTAILEYCALADVTPVIDPALVAKLNAIPVAFIGWTGNVWSYLEQLCAAVTIDEDGTKIEMAIIDNQLHFREALKAEANIVDLFSNSSLDIESYDSAQYLGVNLYKTFYDSDRVVREQNTGRKTYAINENVSITDTLQVEAGETIIKRVKINASLESVNQPVAVSTISQLPFPINHPTGEYVIVGSDDYPVKVSQWVAEGGKLEVLLTDTPNEIEIRLTAPKSVQLPAEDGSPVEVTLAPYKVGVESSGGKEYPALYITGTGVFFETSTITIPTGASEEYAPAIASSQIDNIFLTKKSDLLAAALATSQSMCGPRIALNASLQDGVAFGSTIGALIKGYDVNLSNNGYNSTFRIVGASFNEAGASISAVNYVTISDFNESWAGKTFADFNSVNAGMTFNEFTIIPLVKE